MKELSEQAHRPAARNMQLAVTGFHEQSDHDPIPPLRGFVRSPYNPLIYHAAVKAAEQARSGDIQPERKAILLGSLFTDMMTLQETSKDLLQGRKVSPIMFPPSVPSSVMGYIAKELGVHGPLSCISVTAAGVHALIRQAEDYIEDGEADLVLLTLCDSRSIRSSHWISDHPGEGGDPRASGGVISLALEAAEHAKHRGLKPVIALEAWLETYERNAARGYGLYVPSGGEGRL
ncbi:hypothetical protein [Paenibacillus sp. UNC499MF]|uniref:hypothetical protein n=1 Tax=Paenibacillus sp. UNC499MF TaxID=1502751 RepID=UPI00089FF869|nr:hypothetical protein [Paenibacillus sp. UNC499MF]SEG71417.1 hypothetical protein SAMN02799616_04455 [Paenibacillus sp. UNC499MF]